MVSPKPTVDAAQWDRDQFRCGSSRIRERWVSVSFEASKPIFWSIDDTARLAAG